MLVLLKSLIELTLVSTRNSKNGSANKLIQVSRTGVISPVVMLTGFSFVKYQYTMTRIATYINI